MESRKVTIAAVSGLSGRKIAAKNWSCGPAQLNGPRRVLPLLIFSFADEKSRDRGKPLDLVLRPCSRSAPTRTTGPWFGLQSPPATSDRR